MDASLILGGIVIVLCIFMDRLSNKIGIPFLLAFIVLGMLFGSDGIFGIEFENFKAVEEISTVALIFIMFYGGFGTRWSEARSVARRSILMSTLGVVLTALLVGLFSYKVLNIGVYESFLIGAVLSPTDAASVFSILKTKKLNLKYKTASILELESGSNDPFAYMMTIIILTIMVGGNSSSELIYTVIAQPLLGIICGTLIAFLSYRLLKDSFFTPGFDMAFIIGIAIISYALPSIIGGNGYLSVYITGIILGNKEIKNKRALVNFFDGFTSLMQMAIFFLLGLLALPSQIGSVIVYSISIAVFLTLIARPLVVKLILGIFDSNRSQELLVSWSGLRGASSVVFAIVVTTSSAYTKNDIFHIVFFVVLLSIGIQGTLLPLVAKKLNMIDDRENVLKTFSDYTEEHEIGFISLKIEKNHFWKGKRVSDLSLPPKTIIAMIIRDGKTIVPTGEVEIKEDDKVILSAPGLEKDENMRLVEALGKDKPEWCNKSLSELDIPKDLLIIMIKRGEDIIIPDGNTLIDCEDILVINQSIS